MTVCPCSGCCRWRADLSEWIWSYALNVLVGETGLWPEGLVAAAVLTGETALAI